MDFETRLRRAHAHNHGHEFEKAPKLEHRADSSAEQDSTAAEQYDRMRIAEHPALNGSTATAKISLAELLIDQDDSDGMDKALALLNSFLAQDTARFPSVLLAGI